MTKAEYRKRFSHLCQGPMRFSDDIKETKTRIGCGANVTDMVLDLPEDGEPHEVVCPSCGTVSKLHWTPGTRPIG